VQFDSRKVSKRRFFAPFLLGEQPLGVTREFEQRDSFGKIRFVGVPVPFDLALAAAPAPRATGSTFYQPVERVDIHHVNAIVQPFRFSLKPHDGFLVRSSFIGIAGVKRIAHPSQHLVVEAKPPEQIGELRFEHFLAGIFAAAVGRLPWHLSAKPVHWQ
jgi:uncharacterized protein YbcV (DUF1398 family)